MTTYSDSLKLALIGDGEQTNVWGATTNTNLGTLLEQAIVGVQSITMTGSADYTLTNLNGASDEARNAVLIIEGSSSGGYSVILPAGQQKTYIVTNNLSTGSVDIKPSGGTAATIPNGVTMTIYTDGTATQAVNYVDVAGVATTVANLPGGAAGYIPYQSAANTTSYLVPGTAGYVLTTAGAGLPPYWNPSGTATLASNLAGGAAGQIAYQTGANTTGFTATGTTGQFLSSNGTSPPTWTSTIPTTINGLVAGNGSSFGLANSSQVISALGYTPYNSTNPSGYVTSSTLSGYAALSGATFTGNVKAPFLLNSSESSGILSDGSIRIGNSSTTIFYLSNQVQLAINSNFNYVFDQNGTAYKPGGGSWAALSDARLKENVVPLTGALAKITALNPVSYDWKYNTSEPTVGFIAQEVQQVLPTAVTQTKPTKSQEVLIPDEDLFAVGFQNDMTAYLVGAIKELSAKVTALEEQVLNLSVK